MKKPKGELYSLMNVGKATLRDLELLNIKNIETLAKQEATDLYIKIQKITKQRHDPCVWDVFASIINEAKTGEKTRWWEWTKVRKKKFPNGIKKH